LGNGIHLLAHSTGLYDGGAAAVKLLFLTVELERTERVDDLAGLKFAPCSIGPWSISGSKPLGRREVAALG
jgi:hypothetical protein